ncbi:MAG TPA: PEGA domain-containing protein [Vicinamibacterales bacterium]|nr:PEGA domain-containing protein [Vicinamibacterales bacterium]
MHASPPALQHAVFEDGLGKRHHASAPNGALLEVLELRDEFTGNAFELALRERIAALASFQTTWFSHVRTVQRINHSSSTLFVVYDRVPGARLSTVLAARQQPEPLEINATLYLIRQLVAAIALLHEKLPGVAHGAISLERVIVTPDARVVVADHVLGLALEQLRYSPEKYWKELKIALPAAQPRFNQRADVMQIGTLALELILGRRIEPAEYPHQIDGLIEGAWRTTAGAADQSLPAEFQPWLLRMLQLDASQAFASAVDAWADLEDILGARDNGASFVALESVMAEYARRAPASSAGTRAESVAAPAPAPGATASLPDTASPAPLAASTPTTSAVPSRPPAAPPVSRASAADPAPEDPQSAGLPPASPQDDDVTGDPTRMAPTRRRWMAAAAVLVLLLGGALFGRHYLLPSASAEAPGTLVVTTNPAGFQVFIDGQPRGVTPLTVELAPGAHELKVATEGEPRIIPFTVTAGSTVAQTIEVPRAAPLTGQLMVSSEPAGARVMIDDTLRGTTPLTIDGLTPGTHSVTLQSDLSSITQEVTIEPGIRASLVVPMSAPQGIPVSGWISVVAPAEVQVFEDGLLLGTSQSDRIMVSAGSHALEIVNETLGYRATRSITVAPGKVSLVRLDWPNGSMALNAQPWAEVWVNGKPVGETPIGSIAVPIGTYEVLFRHPELGEQTVRATVTATAPARVIVDLRKQ